MDAALKALYQDIILKHNKAPHGKGDIPEDWARGEARNTTCGDEVKIGLRIDAGHIHEARIGGASCAICTASASMMAEAVEGRSLDSSNELSAQVHEALDGGEPLVPEKHGDIHALNGVHAFPARLRCASLAWEVLDKVLQTDHD